MAVAWPTTTDHKTIGSLYLITSFAFFIIDAVPGSLIAVGGFRTLQDAAGFGNCVVIGLSLRDPYEELLVEMRRMPLERRQGTPHARSCPPRPRRFARSLPPAWGGRQVAADWTPGSPTPESQPDMARRPK